MKKITTILMLLMLTCMGAKADVVTTWTTAGSIVTKDALVASAGTGARYAFRMPSNSQPGWCGFNSTTGRVDILDVDHLFTIENGSVAGKYWLKRYSNGEYLSGNNAFSASAGVNLTLTARIPDNVTDYDTGYSNSTPFVSFDNDGGGHYNNGNSNYDFRGGTGGWSVYVTYGPFYLVTINCVDEAGDPIPGQAPTVKIVTDGSEVSIAAPEITGYSAQAGYQTSVNVNGADVVVNITYTEASTRHFTYQIVDNDGNELFTSAPAETNDGATISTLPAEYQNTLFYTYSGGGTVTEDNQVITFTATLKESAPFIPSVSFDAATWYYLNLKGGAAFPTYAESGNPNVTLPGANAENDNTSWAFIVNKNTYPKFQIINKAAGGNVVLGSALNVQNDGANGGNTFATLNAPGTKACETWTIESSSHYTNGFFIRNADGHALNYRSANNLAYWSGGADAGSTFVAAKVPERQIPYIQALDEMENGKVYAIYNARGIWKFAENATSMGTEGVPSDLEALCATPAATYQIGLVKQNDKFYIYNVAQGKYLAAGNKLYQSPLEAVTIEASTSSVAVGNYKWFFSFDSNHNINVSSGKVLIDTWNTHDQGNVNAIMVTDATYTVADALAAFTDYTQCITDYCDYKGITTDFVQNIGQFGYPKAGTEATTAFLDILDRNASGANTAEDWNTFIDKYNAVFAAENMKMPEAGNFYRIKGYSGNYITLNTAASNASMSGGVISLLSQNSMKKERNPSSSVSDISLPVFMSKSTFSL